MRFFTALSLVFYALLAIADPATYTLHHRVHHATLPHLPYAKRGTIHIADDGSASLQPSPSLSQDLAAFSESISELDASLDNLYYQLALEREDQDQSSWDFTSVKAVCNSQFCSPGVLPIDLSHCTVPSVPGDITDHHPSYSGCQTPCRGLFCITYPT